MKPIFKETEEEDFLSEDEDPKGPMMHWEGPRSDKDVEFMSKWVMARKAELAKEQAHSADKAE
jgi:hypothetical protein